MERERKLAANGNGTTKTGGSLRLDTILNILFCIMTWKWRPKVVQEFEMVYSFKKKIKLKGMRVLKYTGCTKNCTLICRNLKTKPCLKTLEWLIGLIDMEVNFWKINDQYWCPSYAINNHGDTAVAKALNQNLSLKEKASLQGYSSLKEIWHMVIDKKQVALLHIISPLKPFFDHN